MQSKHLGLCLNSNSLVLTSSLVKKHLRVWNHSDFQLPEKNIKT